jgi:hypothetical protein
MKVTRVGLDIAKQVFQAHGVDARGVPSVRKRLARAKVLEFFVTLPPCLIGIEASGGAPLLGAGTHQTRSYGEADRGAVRHAVSQEGQKRCERCGGDLRSGGPPEHALCGGQERRAAGSADGASSPHVGACQSNGAGEPDPRTTR